MTITGTMHSHPESLVRITDCPLVHSQHGGYLHTNLLEPLLVLLWNLVRVQGHQAK